jgi:hypothetical protein
MNAAIARALSFALAVLVWTAISHIAKLPLQLWPVIAGLGCFVGTGGGVAGVQKAAAAIATGVAWALLGYSVSGALGRQQLVDALVMGAVVFGMVFQARLPLLSYTGGAIVGAATALGARVVNIEGGLRVAIALVIGVGLGYAAEQGAGMIKTKGK